MRRFLYPSGRTNEKFLCLVTLEGRLYYTLMFDEDTISSNTVDAIRTVATRILLQAVETPDEPCGTNQREAGSVISPVARHKEISNPTGNGSRNETAV